MDPGEAYNGIEDEQYQDVIQGYEEADGTVVLQYVDPESMELRSLLWAVDRKDLAEYWDRVSMYMGENI